MKKVSVLFFKLQDTNLSKSQSNYIEKTDRNIITRLNENGTRNEKSMFQHLKPSENILNMI